ncbi:OmpP1/FadL family transporter [Aliiroseovarius crassostreae]|uniref:OmpP1/FadL family transporter n=1 Tax=Aliiroseovarius crassostreae TaxID=154981 RepID=UPI003C7BBFFC
MKGFALTAASAALTATAGFAGGIDRSGQDMSILFEEGNYLKFGLITASPDVPAQAAGFASQSADSFNSFSFALKKQINENLSFSLIADEPYGADIRYTDGPLGSLGLGIAARLQAPTALGGSGLPAGHPLVAAFAADPNGRALVDSKAITALGRYEFGNGFSVHGGLRAQKVSGVILSGSGLLDAESDFDFGGVVGVAYEKPEIAMRVALTYNSAITHDLEGTHNLLPTIGEVRIPESFNLDFQTGIAQNTLLFGSIRHVKWNGTKLSTTQGAVTTDWVEFVDDSTTLELGVGRKLNENWSIAAMVGYEDGADTGTTFLAPTGTSKSIGLGATYTKDAIKVSGGVRYIMFEDKTVTSAPLSATFDGSAVVAGLSVGISF